MRAANAIADAVREPYPHLLVDFLAYHDTSVPAGKVTPAANLALMYAPRQRCYAHPLGDPHCPRNVEYAQDSPRPTRPSASGRRPSSTTATTSCSATWPCH